MTLTNDQIIQVAETLWKWERCEAKKGSPLSEHLPIYWAKLREHENELRTTYDENQLKDEVNSWSGFGRTAEIFHIVTKHRMIATGFNLMKYLAGQCNKEEFISEFHLAALEAIDAEGS